MRIVDTSSDISMDYLLNMNTITHTFFSVGKKMLYSAINHYSLKSIELLGKRHCSRQHKLTKKCLESPPVAPPLFSVSQETLQFL